MKRLNDFYKDHQDKEKYPGPYRPKDTMIVIAGPGMEEDELPEDLGDEDDPGPTMPDQEKDMVRISRKEYEDLCRKAGM